MVDTGGAGISAFERGFGDAFPEAYASQPFPQLELGGATDGGLVDGLFAAYGLDHTAEASDRFYTRYLARLDAGLAASDGRGLPGVAELVTAVKDAGHHLGLLTGNVEAAAHLKLKHYGYQVADFPIGAFGDDFSDRNRLGPVAMERAALEYDRTFSPEEVYVLGDTLKDIACARACGAQAVAVATGACRFEVLAEAHPDYLFRDFTDTSAVLAALSGLE